MLRIVSSPDDKDFGAITLATVRIISALRTGVNITQPGQGYAASLIRAKLVGADSHTKLDDKYAGTDALTRYTADSSILSCFPSVLRDAIGTKALSGVSAASSGNDVRSNDGVADKLWLFSYGEMMNTVYPSAGFSNSTSSDAKRSSKTWWWLRSPWSFGYAHGVIGDGNLGSSSGVSNSRAVAPGFTLVSSDDDGIGRDVG